MFVCCCLCCLSCVCLGDEGDVDGDVDGDDGLLVNIVRFLRCAYGSVEVFL